MNIKNSIFFRNDWKWSSFLNYLISQLEYYQCEEFILPPEFSFHNSSNKFNKTSKIANLITWAVFSKKINFARAICINSSMYSVLNFLIIPQTNFNVPFFGVDFVSLPKYYLIVLDLQPSILLQKQFTEELLTQIIDLKNECHQTLPIAEPMSSEVSNFFSPGLIWSKLPKNDTSEKLIANDLFLTFKKYLNLYLKILFNSEFVDKNLQLEIIKGQRNYLEYRKNKDPARPMLKSLFGKDFSERLINNVLFTSR